MCVCVLGRLKRYSSVMRGKQSACLSFTLGVSVGTPEGKDFEVMANIKSKGHRFEQACGYKFPCSTGYIES